MKKVKEKRIVKNSETAIYSLIEGVIIISEYREDKHTVMANIGRWGSMFFNFLKALLFGLCVFIYDMYSKSQIQ